MRELLNRTCAVLVAAWIVLPAGLAWPWRTACTFESCNEAADPHLSSVLGAVAVGGTAAIVGLLRSRRR